jgi:hypothetical protein
MQGTWRRRPIINAGATLYASVPADSIAVHEVNPWNTVLGMKILGTIVRVVLLTGLAGCGSGAPTTFPNQLLDNEEQPILLDDIETIVNDTDLTDDEKREQLRELGIEDEELIDALLTL